MEIVALIVGPIAGIFVIIFGGRGLVDLVRGARERREARAEANTAAIATLEPPPGSAPTPAASPAPQYATPPDIDPVYRRTFVGRDAELKMLRDAFDEAANGHGSLAMVVGEPGIGKTSLCEQLAAHVAGQGGRTLVGHCYEEGSLSLPYLGFVEAVRSHVLALPEAELRTKLGHGSRSG